jgi:hypothetical protein
MVVVVEEIKLSIMVTVNLKLDKKTEQLFNDLEVNTGIEKDEIISGVLNGRDSLENLVILNGILKREKENPNPETYTNEEMKKILGF